MDQPQVVDVVKKRPIRWLDSLYYSDQTDMDLERLAEDKVVLEQARFLKATTEHELARHVGVPADNKRFQASLSRLTVKACITRRSHRWDGVKTQSWVPIDNPQIEITAKGEYLASLPMPTQDEQEEFSDK